MLSFLDLLLKFLFRNICIWYPFQFELRWFSSCTKLSSQRHVFQHSLSLLLAADILRYIALRINPCDQHYLGEPFLPTIKDKAVGMRSGFTNDRLFTALLPNAREYRPTLIVFFRVF